MQRVLRVVHGSYMLQCIHMQILVCIDRKKSKVIPGFFPRVECSSVTNEVKV